MAIQNIDPTVISRAGTTDTLAPANADGYLVANAAELAWIEVANASGSAITVTLTIVRLVDGQTPAAKQVTIPATTGRKKIGNFPRKDYNNADERVLITFSAVTSVTFGAWALPESS